MDTPNLINRYSSPATIRDFTELKNLAQESNPELQAESLLHFAGRQERIGRADIAATAYQEILAKSEAFGNPALAFIYRRAQARFRGLTGENAEYGARFEVLLRDFARQATEPSLLFAMGLAGAAFRVTGSLALSRLTANSSAHLFTRGLGARALARLAAFSVEAPVFTLAERLGAEALGHSQNWGGKALGRNFASGFMMLGALRAGGVLSSRIYRGLGRWGESKRLPFSARSSLQGLIQQSGVLAGILGGQRLAELTGLSEARLGSSALAEGLALLFQFNAAGRLSRQAFGERFHQWESNIELRTEGLARRNRKPSRGSFFGEGEWGLQSSLALSPIEGRMPRRGNPKTPLDFHQAFTVGGRGEKAPAAKVDQVGLEIVRGLQTLPFPDRTDIWVTFRKWIETQPYAIVAGELVMNSDLAIVEMINRPFAEQLLWSEESLRGRSVRVILHSSSDAFVGTRVTLLALKLLSTNFAEYKPTRMRMQLPDGSQTQVVGAGAILSIRDQKIAVGIFTEIGRPEIRESITPVPASSVRPTPSSATTAKDHFKAVQEALNPHSKDEK